MISLVQGGPAPLFTANTSIKPGNGSVGGKHGFPAQKKLNSIAPRYETDVPALRRIAPLQTAKTKSISEEFGASELLALIMEDFYGRQASDAILCHFFMEKDHLEIARKQTAFLLKMLGFTKSTRSKSPADAHKNLAQILPGHFTRRAQILKETLKDWGFDEDELQSWLHFEHSFEEQIKKGQAE